MTNDAAERLRSELVVGVDEPDEPARALLDEALAAERRATVERIREAYELAVSNLYGGAPDEANVRAILDAEAER